MLNILVITDWRSYQNIRQENKGLLRHNHFNVLFPINVLFEFITWSVLSELVRLDYKAICY